MTRRSRCVEGCMGRPVADVQARGWTAKMTIVKLDILRHYQVFTFRVSCSYTVLSVRASITSKLCLTRKRSSCLENTLMLRPPTPLQLPVVACRANLQDLPLKLHELRKDLQETNIALLESQVIHVNAFVVLSITMNHPGKRKASHRKAAASKSENLDS
eukprot:755211-Hanusia_phi.AAC.3